MCSRQFNQDTSCAKKAAENGPVYITDRGRPAHVLMTFDDSVGSFGCQCLIEAGTFALGTADAVVDVDAIRRHAALVRRLSLGCEVLLVS